MTKHSRSERAKRAAETGRLKEIEAAWIGSLSTETAAAFNLSVAAARARGPRERQPDMAPGTAPRPPRPGREPRPSKDEERRRPRRD